MDGKAGLRIVYSNQKLGHWMGGWMDGWVEVKAGLRIAYSNQKVIEKSYSKVVVRCSHSSIGVLPRFWTFSNVIVIFFKFFFQNQITFYVFLNTKSRKIYLGKN